jgi:hypothetical protein
LHGQRVGYIRVSSFDQNPERQLAGVAVDRMYTDQASVKDMPMWSRKRPCLRATTLTGHLSRSMWERSGFIATILFPHRLLLCGASQSLVWTS